jgi:bifunctional ADP-heptose synthase (sugar kinase/adenylyltransferase)
MGDHLVVGLTMDAYVGKAGRPIVPQEERKEILQALRCVSAVGLCKDSLQALEHWRPDVFVKGFDRQQIGLLPEEMEFCEAHGIEIRFTKENPQHSSDLLERIRCAA